MRIKLNAALGTVRPAASGKVQVTNVQKLKIGKVFAQTLKLNGSGEVSLPKSKPIPIKGRSLTHVQEPVFEVSVSGPITTPSLGTSTTQFSLKL